MDVATMEPHRPSRVAIVMNIALDLLDTLAAGRGALVRRGEPLSASFSVPIVEPLFGARLLVAAGSGWVAWADGAEPRVTVIRSTGDTVLIEWTPLHARTTEADRVQAARWAGEYTLRASASARDNASQMSARDREAQYRRLAQILPFTDTLPELTALFGAGSCLWLAGFSLEGNAFGVAATMIVVDVREGALLGTARVPGRGARVRAASTEAIYAALPDEDGLEDIVAYGIPFECATVRVGSSKQ
jgi:hypothetical protein